MPERARTTKDLVDNPAPRTPCVLLLDTSRSMEGDPIQRLEEGVRQFLDDITKDTMSRWSAEIAIVTFGGEPAVVADFSLVDKITPPVLNAEGVTPLTAAVETAERLLHARLDEYKSRGVSRHRPVIVLMTDGQPTDDEGNPTDDYKDVAARLSEAASLPSGDEDGIQICCVGMGDEADLSVLQEFLPEGQEPLKLTKTDFANFFHGVSVYIGKAAKGPGASTTEDWWEVLR